MMRIAESYFRQLLFETEPLEAVTRLSSVWSPRARSQEPCFGLALPEYNVTLCMTYSGEVGNGGHLQFFLNRGGRAARETLTALHTVGLTRAKDILHKACDRFPDSFVPDLPDAVDSVLGSLPDTFGQAFQALDAELFAERIDNILLTYLRRNAEQILLLERGIVS